jgi:hypothetical protein
LKPGIIATGFRGHGRSPRFGGGSGGCGLTGREGIGLDMFPGLLKANAERLKDFKTNAEKLKN